MKTKRRALWGLTVCLVSLSALATDMATLPETPLKANISNRHINRILTPFEQPSIKTDALDGVVTKQEGSVLYFSTTQSTPIAAFITPKGDESQSIKVTLYPAPIESQQVTLPAKRIERFALPATPSEASDHVDALSSILTDSAKGLLPDGFRLETRPKNVPACQQAGLSFDFHQGQFLVSNQHTLWVGTVRNTRQNALQFRESACYQEGVQAVASFPGPVFAPGTQGEVYLLMARDAAHTPQAKRPSLLGASDE